MATLNTIESRYSIKTNQSYSLSVQQVIDCSEGVIGGNDGCDNGYIDKTITYAKDKGMMSTADYGYKGFEWDCNYDANKLTPVRPTGFVQLQAKNATAYKAALNDGPIAVLVDADNMAFKYYQSGILNSDRCGTDRAEHAVMLVGWGVDNATSLEYFIAKNSWGYLWGEDGYARIAIVNGPAGLGMCGMHQFGYYPTF